MYEEVLERVIQVLKNIVDDNSIEITADSDIMEDLGLASLDMFYLLSEAEVEFGFEISDNYLRNIVTVADMAKIVTELIEEKNK